MSFKKTVLLLAVFFMISYAGSHQDNKDATSTNDEAFVPTKEWKVVKKGQPIPQGLHVRMNLQTGITEAKLMDISDSDDSGKKTALFAVEPPSKEKKSIKIVQTPHHVDGVHVMETEDGGQTVFANGKLTPQQLEDALQNLNFEDMEVATDEDIDRVKEQFRSMDELKEDLADLNLGMRSESEEVSEIIQDFLKSETNEEVQLAALKDLEYIAHHVDAARDLIQRNGIKLVIIPALNSSLHSLQSAGARLLGAASQGNPEVQLAALREGVIRLLLRQVVPGIRDPLDEVHLRHKSVIYALSCLVRGFPAGQRNLIEEGGLSVLAKFFDDANTDTKVRITTLLHDLVLEAHQASNAQAKSQYEALKLKMLLPQYGWCERVSSLLYAPNVDLRASRDDSSSAVPAWPVGPEHDIIERVVTAMIVLSPQCKNKFIDQSQTVQELLASYTELAAQEKTFGSEENFYLELLQLVQELENLISPKDEL